MEARVRIPLGLRRGEILALRRRDLGVLQRTVDVRQTAEHLSDGTVGFKSPKTAAGRRKVQLVPLLSPSWSDASSPPSDHPAGPPEPPTADSR